MNWFDWMLAVIFVVSIVGGALSGMARMAVGLTATLAGIIFAARYFRPAGAFLRDYVGSPAIANAIGFAIVLVLFLILGALAGRTLAAAFRSVGIAWIDHLGGAAFGAARALLIAIAVVMVGLSLPRHTLPETIQQSRFAPYIAESAQVLASIAPPELKDAFTRNYEDVRRAWSEIWDSDSSETETLI